MRLVRGTAQPEHRAKDRGIVRGEVGPVEVRGPSASAGVICAVTRPRLEGSSCPGNPAMREEAEARADLVGRGPCGGDGSAHRHRLRASAMRANSDSATAVTVTRRTAAAQRAGPAPSRAAGARIAPLASPHRLPEPQSRPRSPAGSTRVMSVGGTCSVDHPRVPRGRRVIESGLPTPNGLSCTVSRMRHLVGLQLTACPAQAPSRL